MMLIWIVPLMVILAYVFSPDRRDLAFKPATNQFCAHCGQPVEAGWKNCLHCGQEL